MKTIKATITFGTDEDGKPAIESVIADDCDLSQLVYCIADELPTEMEDYCKNWLQDGVDSGRADDGHYDDE